MLYSTAPETTDRQEEFRPVVAWAWDQETDGHKGKLVLVALAYLMPSFGEGLALTPEKQAHLEDMTQMSSHKLYPTINGLANNGYIFREKQPHQPIQIWANYKSIPFLEYTPVEKDRPGTVYLLRSENLYKIGKTVNIGERYRTLATGAAFGLDIDCTIDAPDCVAYERYLHEHYAKRRRRGEWFALSPGDVRSIRKAFGAKR